MSFITQTCRFCGTQFSLADLAERCGDCERYLFMGPTQLLREADRLEHMADALRKQAAHAKARTEGEPSGESRECD